MKFPQAKLTTSFASRSLMLLLAITAIAVSVPAQKFSTPTKELIPAAPPNIDQCSNGARGATELACTGGQWQNGNLNRNNSQWVEGEFVPYRVLFTDLDANSTGNTITITYDTTEGGLHTLDYLGTYNTSTIPGNDPCSGVTPCAPGNTWPIPIDSNVTNAGVTQIGGQVFTIWNGTITGVSGYTLSGTYAGTSQTSITITFSVGADPNAVIAWGGHISTRQDWGVANSAIQISGSSYHMRIGGQDRSMKVDAAIFPARLTIIKEVRTLASPADIPNWTTSDFAFDFTYSQGLVTSPFTLVDDVVGDGGGGPPLSVNATEVFAGIVSFDAANSITVVEANYQPTWTLASITCVEDPGGLPQVDNSTGTLATRTATIIAEEAEFITCAFRNTQLQPTAAPVSISGRVYDPSGYGLAFARISVMNASTGEVRSATTNHFGYYNVGDLSAGDFYMVTVSHKRYSFGQQFVTANDNVAGLDFSANPE